jgi:hypothetical protein
MANSDGSSSARQLLLYFGLMSLLVNVVNPGFVLDIPTSEEYPSRTRALRYIGYYVRD